MKDDIAANPSKRVRQVFQDAAAQTPLPANSDDEDFVPEYFSVKSALSRKKRQLYPLMPRRIRDVHINGNWRRTWNNRSFLCAQNNRWGILLYMTARNCTRLVQCDEILVDGTFKCCPKPYTQIVTLHGRFHDRVIPFAFCLLKGKQVGVYRKLLRVLKDKVLQVTGQNLNPHVVICDFEVSLITAIQTELPHTSVKGCYFHFTKSIWRRVSKLGLATAYKRNRRFSNFVRKIMAMAYLPTAVVRPNWQLIGTSHTVQRITRRYPTVLHLINYFERNYIRGQFPPGLWNVYNRDSVTRTNNHVEGKHCNYFYIFCY